MKTSKRILALFLLAAMVFTMLPMQVFAAEGQTQASVDTGDLSVQGTNGFGSLLSKEIQEAEAEEESEGYDPGYQVTDLVIEGSKAYVSYSSMEDALLMVALYTEDGMQMLTSASARVSAEDTEASVQFTGTMPEYFMASAYLVDTYDCSPLCASYDTPMYTREMQELLESTVDDYDEELVLNLDDDKTTNFAVYTEDTIVIEPVSGKNTIVSMDDETATYIIGNVDKQISSLSAGDIFVYPYAENEILIVKVASIKVASGKAAITGEELDIEEVFSHVKIENASSSSDIEIEEDSGDEGVTVNNAPRKNGIQPNAFETDIGGKGHLSFNIFKEFKDEKADAAVELKGTFDLSLEINLSFYVSWHRQYISLKADAGVAFSGSVSGKITASMDLPKLKVDPLPCVSVSFPPKLKVEFSGELVFEMAFKWTVGAAFSSDCGFTNLTTKPDWDGDIKLKADLFIGVDLYPGVEIFSGKVVSANLTHPVGLKFECEANEEKGTQEALDIQHDCGICFAGYINLVAELGVEINFLKCSWMKFEEKFSLPVVKLSAFYYSQDHDDFGLGSCPHCSYRTAIEVTTFNGIPVPNAQVNIEGFDPVTLNQHGVGQVYLPAGEYVFTTTVNDVPCRVTRKIPEHTKILLSPIYETITDTPDGPELNFDEILEDNEGINDSSTATFGSCGAQGNNVTWTLSDDGLLKISGKGDMKDYKIANGAWGGYTPWNWSIHLIRAVEIENGVTSIGNAAFEWCFNLTEITIPDSVTSIGDQAFYNCLSLPSVTISDKVTSIGKNVFGYCSALNGIYVDEKNPNYSSDQYGAIFNKSKTTLIQFPKGYSGTYTIPNSVSTISDYAFYCCDNLTAVTVPDSLTTIGDHAFNGCSALTSITIPKSVTTLGNYAFSNCGGLSSITIPGNVTELGQYAFFSCDNLYRATIGNGVTTISKHAFYWCMKLANLTIPASVTTIEDGAFDVCDNLYFVNYGGTLEQWNQIAIGPDNDDLLESIIVCYGTDISNAGDNITADRSEELTEELQEKSDFDAEQKPPSVNAVYPGFYGSEENEKYTVKTAFFKNLVPGQQYLLLAMSSITTPNLLASNNLLYVDQAPASEDGTLTFRYVPRETASISYVVACGASNKDLKDAKITFPEMTADGALQVVDPTVVYDGKTLTEGLDYVIVGTTSFSDAGTYTCSIRGIRKYTGLVECTYTVGGADLKPNSPTLTISNVASSGKIKLTWKAVDGAVKYEVYRASSKNGTYDLKKTTTGTSFTNTSTTAGKTYYYYVVAVAENGAKSDPSGTKSRTCDLPRPVVTLTNVASTGKIKISWEAVDGAVEYEVYRATSKDGTYSKLTTTENTTTTNTSVTAGKTYYYKVKAIAENSAANSAYSEMKSRTCDLPQTTVTLSNVASTGKIKVSWEAVEGATKYEVHRATSKDGTYKLLKTTTGTSYTNTGAEAGKTYYYKVRAICDVEAAAAAYSEVKSRTCDLPRPDVSIALSASKPKVSWKEVEGAVEYEVYRATSKSGTYSKVKTTTSLSYKDSKATSGKTYYYKVVAVASKSSANSAYSGIVSIKSK